MPISQQIARMIDVLPAEDQLFAFEFVKKLILAWDPDFTKVTPDEAAAIAEAEAEFARGETVRHEDVDWD